MYEEEEIRDWLKAKVSPRRFLHSLGVYEAVTGLAQSHGVDAGPLKAAALLHDSARELSHHELLLKAEGWRIPIRDVDRESPVLLHGRVSAEMAGRELSIREPAVVSAIIYHTAGHPEMTLSDKLFYLADHIEPTRTFSHVERIREASCGDVDAAVLIAIEVNLSHLKRTGQAIDPDTMKLQKVLQGVT